MKKVWERLHENLKVETWLLQWLWCDIGWTDGRGPTSFCHSHLGLLLSLVWNLLINGLTKHYIRTHPKQFPSSVRLGDVHNGIISGDDFHGHSYCVNSKEFWQQSHSLEIEPSRIIEVNVSPQTGPGEHKGLRLNLDGFRPMFERNIRERLGSTVSNRLEIIKAKSYLIQIDF